MLLKFSAPVMKKSKSKDNPHEYASSQIIVDGIAVGYVVKHSEVQYGVALPKPQGSGLVWEQFTGRDDALAYVRKNAQKAYEHRAAQSGGTLQTTLGL